MPPPIYAIDNAARFRSRTAESGFTLIEVTLAIGIVAFAFVALFGLIPTGLTMFRNSIDTSISTQILQQVTDNAQQTDFDVLVDQYTTKDKPYLVHYYDDQATDLGTSPTSNSIYTVYTKFTATTLLPYSTDGGVTNTGVLSNNLGRLQVKIVKDPGKKAFTGDPFSSNSTLQGSTFVAYVARNKSTEVTL